MSDLETKMNALSEKIGKMEKQAVNSTKMYAVVYLILVLFVFGYTNFIMSWIKQEVTPDKLSGQMRLIIERDLLSNGKCDAAVSYCKERAPVWADNLVGMTHDQVIPMAKDKVKEMADKTSDEAIELMKKELLPGIKELINANASELKKHEDITDRKIANEIAKIMVDESEREMNAFINDKVKKRISFLREDLDKLSSTPIDKLSRKQAAERQLIVGWIYLLEHDESPADSLGELLKGINGTYKDFMKDLSIPD